MLARVPLRARILIGFALALALALALGGVAVHAVSSLSGHVLDLGGREFPTKAALGGVDAALHSATRGMNGLLAQRIVGDPTLRAAAHGLVETGRAQLAEARGAIGKLFVHDEDQVAWRTITPALDAWDAAAGRFVAAARDRDGSSGEARVAADDRLFAEYQTVRAAYVAVKRPLEGMSALVDKDVAAAQASASADARSYHVVVLATFLLGAAGIAAIGLLLSRAIGLAIRGTVDEATRLRAAVDAGALTERGDPAKVHRDFRGIVDGFNGILDAYERPVRLTAEYVTRISNGDLPPRIAERYEGEFNGIKDALNRCIDTLTRLTSDVDAMTRQQVAGDYEAFLVPARFEGSYRKLAEGVDANVKHHVDAILEILGTFKAYADGDFSRTIRRFAGKQAVANEIVDGVRDNLRSVAAEVQALTAAAVGGKLSTRADAARFKGDWAALVGGVNATLDAVVGPLAVAAQTVERISRGDVPAPIAERYEGDFAALRDNLNTCIRAVAALVGDADRLSAAAIAGELSTRADASRHQGDFAKIVDGVNRTLDAVIAPVHEAAGVLDRLAGRDLRARMTGTYRGDHGRIQRAVNGTAEALHEALAQVAGSVEQVSSAATQIAESSQAVASGASEQATSLEETTSSIESVSGMTRASADHAHQAHLLVQGTRVAATAGASAVEQMQGAMSRIKASSEGTSQIIKDVSEIAFQTNLLALNAAVEAARAGEAGRGFAVVAEEVRSLALRAKEAATKTEELIRQSVKEANEGERSARDVAGKLEEIVGGVSKVTAIVSEIAAAAQEQTSGIGAVSRAVAEMDKVTQQNAASAEESSSAASELSGQAEELAAMVGSFQLERAAAVRALPDRRTPARAGARPGLPPRARNGTNGAHADPFPMSGDEPVPRDFRGAPPPRP